MVVEMQSIQDETDQRQQQQTKKRQLDQNTASTSLAALAGRQRTLVECARQVSKDDCDGAVARYLYSSGSPFHTVEDCGFTATCA